MENRQDGVDRKEETKGCIVDVVVMFGTTFVFRIP